MMNCLHGHLKIILMFISQLRKQPLSSELIDFDPQGQIYKFNLKFTPILSLSML